MNLKDRNTQIILACIVVALLIFSVNVFHLAYNLASWESFGGMSVVPARLDYFVADTPDIIGFKDMDTGERVECAETVAYVETDSGEPYRCCQAERKVACLAGDFSSEVLSSDPTCNATLSDAFGVPASLPGARDYQIYGSCLESGNSQLTVAQIDADGQIQWKTVTLFGPSVISSGLRCFIAPALMVFAIWTFIQSRRKPDPDRQIRKW